MTRQPDVRTQPHPIWRDEMMDGGGNLTLTAIVSGRPNPDDLSVVGSTLLHNDARLIIAAVEALPALLDAAAERDALVAKVERVRELHRESRGSMSALYPNPICECGKDYPCPTVCALDESGTDQ